MHRTALASGASQVPELVWDILKQFEPKLLAVQEPKPSVLADIPIEQLLSFGRAVIDHRSSLLEVARQPPQDPAVSTAPLPGQSLDPLAAGAASFTSAQMTGVGASAVQPDILGLAAAYVQFAISAYDAFKNAVTVSPIGMLHLERIETAPAGIERGELVGTIPLAPKETTTVVQKEWTVTSQEFSSIVTDFMENYSEKGVTEKTELSEATESQTKHSQQLGLNASASGSYGFVTFATSATFNSQTEEQNSQKESRKHAAEVTQKASSRVRKERKVTIQTTSVKGKEDTTTRTLTNPSETDAMRIDYFSMMRKWRVRLLQYGLRMTYDIAIPEPGATLRQMHARLAELDQQLRGAFTFEIDPKLTHDELFALAVAQGVSVTSPPEKSYLDQNQVTLIDSSTSAQGGEVAFDIREGYRVSSVTVGGYGRARSDSEMLGVHFPIDDLDLRNTMTTGDLIGSKFTPFPATLGSVVGQTGHIQIRFTTSFVRWGELYFLIATEPTSAHLQSWRQSLIQALYNAKRDIYYSELQARTQEREALRAKLENVDTLTLRREEREEIMKGVLRWLLGPSFQFMPDEVIASFKESAASLSQGVGFTGNKLGLDTVAWSTMLAYQEMVKFLHQAIEWENLLYLTYPYFWDVPTAWDFVRTLQHPDSTREQFLRAGSARVVLTIRPGYEGDFAAFVDKGDLSKVLNGDHPYLSIGNDLQVRANANYPGIPPANPEPSPRPLLTPLQRKAWSDMQLIIKQLEAYSGQNGAYPTTNEGLSVLPPLPNLNGPPIPLPTTDPWGKAYVYKSPGAYKDYELSSLGADGKSGGEGDNADVTSWADASLIAEWFEYTPTHGIDIQLTSALPQIA